jgi:hypothetical protein
MSGAAALAIAMALAAPGELQLEAGVASVGRSRTTVQSGAPSTTNAEATLAPRISAALAGADASGALGYHPTLSTPDLLTRDEVSVLHAADARVQLRLDGPWQLGATAQGARGTTDMLTESRRVAGDLQTITARQQVRYRSARTDLRLEGSTDPRTRWTASAGWFTDGGEDAASRAAVPVERGVRGEAMLRWNATPRDLLGARLEAIGTEILDRTGAFAGLAGSWRRRLTPAFDGWVGGGALGTLDRRPGEDRRGIVPTAELGVSYAEARRDLYADVVTRLGAIIDRGTGDVARQLEAIGTARWAFAAAWTLSGSAAGNVVRTDPGDVRRVSLQTHLGWAATSHVTFGAGVYGDWQLAVAPGLPSFHEGGIFLMAAAETAARRPHRRERP